MTTTLIKKAETFRRALKIEDMKNNRIPDLSECVVYSQMRDNPGGNLLGDAVCSINASQGVISVVWSKEQTAQWPVGSAGYDIWLVSGDEQKPIFTETVSIIEGYTEISEE